MRKTLELERISECVSCMAQSDILEFAENLGMEADEPLAEDVRPAGERCRSISVRRHNLALIAP